MCVLCRKLSLVVRVQDSLAVRRESGQILYYVSCLIGVLIGYLPRVMSCDFPREGATEPGTRETTQQQPKLSTWLMRNNESQDVTRGRVWHTRLLLFHNNYKEGPS